VPARCKSKSARHFIEHLLGMNSSTTSSSTRLPRVCALLLEFQRRLTRPPSSHQSSPPRSAASHAAPPPAAGQLQEQGRGRRGRGRGRSGTRASESGSVDRGDARRGRKMLACRIEAVVRAASGARAVYMCMPCEVHSEAEEEITWDMFSFSSKDTISTIIKIFSRQIPHARSTTHSTYPTDLTA